MTKRQHISLQDIAGKENLALATYKAARGKRQRPAVARWLAHFDANLADLSHSILSGAAPFGQCTQFTVFDPKRRSITAACFSDRVLHHAIFNFAQARFDGALAPGVFACRSGKGVHAAVLQVQQGLQRYPWVVQVDVADYFASIQHAVLLAQLNRLFKGQAFLNLLARIVAGHGSMHGLAERGHAGSVCKQGLPIGALASQHFANHYLGPVDRLLEALPGVACPVRYMDDMVWFCTRPEAARDSFAAVRRLVQGPLGLRLKDAVVMRPTEQGLQFCGYQVRRGTLWPGQRKRRRYRQAVAQLQSLEVQGQPQEILQRVYATRHAALLPAHSLQMRQQQWWPASGAALPHGDQSMAL